MEAHELEIEIRPNGKIQVHVAGAKGPACLEYVKLLESLIGPSKNLQLTDEYYEPPSGVRMVVDQKI